MFISHLACPQFLHSLPFFFHLSHPLSLLFFPPSFLPFLSWNLPLPCPSFLPPFFHLFPLLPFPPSLFLSFSHASSLLLMHFLPSFSFHLSWFSSFPSFSDCLLSLHLPGTVLDTEDTKGARPTLPPRSLLPNGRVSFFQPCLCNSHKITMVCTRLISSLQNLKAIFSPTLTAMENRWMLSSSQSWMTLFSRWLSWDSPSVTITMTFLTPLRAPRASVKASFLE